MFMKKSDVKMHFYENNRAQGGDCSLGENRELICLNGERIKNIAKYIAAHQNRLSEEREAFKERLKKFPLSTQEILLWKHLFQKAHEVCFDFPIRFDNDKLAAELDMTTEELKKARRVLDEKRYIICDEDWFDFKTNYWLISPKHRFRILTLHGEVLKAATVRRRIRGVTIHEKPAHYL